MAKRKDYYEILGINKNASPDEIKKAYRNLAREHHPDMVSKGDKEAAEVRFKEINEAYQVLSDPQKRRMYDQFGHRGGQGFPGGKDPFGGAQGAWGPFTYSYSSSGFNDFDPFDIFEDFFGFRGFGGRRRPKKGKNLYYEIRIDFKDAVVGFERTINVESGKVKIKVPAGVHDATEIRFSGKGMPGPDKTPNGDLYITVRLRMPKEFQRVGDNLITAVEIGIVEAALGEKIDVPVIDPQSDTGIGKAKLKVPSGTQPGSQFKLRGKGMPRLRGNGRGDVIVQVFVKVPKNLNRKQKSALQDFQKL